MSSKSKGGAAARGGQQPDRRAQLEKMRREQARRERLRVTALVTGTALVAVVLIVLVVVFSGGSGKKATTAATGADSTIDRSSSILATTASEVAGQSVDGIQCETNEQTVYHIHAHLAIYVNGQPKLIPYGIGIVPPYNLEADGNSSFVAGGTCLYWLHTHDESGIIHIESPSQKLYTLGNLFNEWQQPLTANQVGPAKGALTIVVNDKPYTGDPRALKLNAHDVIQISVGQVVPFKKYTFADGL